MLTNLLKNLKEFCYGGDWFRGRFTFFGGSSNGMKVREFSPIISKAPFSVDSREMNIILWFLK